MIRKYIASALAVLVTTLLCAGTAYAGEDGAWAGAVTFFSTALGGGYGKMVALACLAWGVWGVFARSLINILMPIVIALAVTVGPGIVGGIVTATI